MFCSLFVFNVRNWFVCALVYVTYTHHTHTHTATSLGILFNCIWEIDLRQSTITENFIFDFLAYWSHCFRIFMWRDSFSQRLNNEPFHVPRIENVFRLYIHRSEVLFVKVRWRLSRICSAVQFILNLDGFFTEWIIMVELTNLINI